jgi:hypothetical protein
LNDETVGAGEQAGGGGGAGQPAGDATAAIDTTRRSGDERKAMLAQQLQQAATRGLRVESQTDFQAVLVEGKPVNHVLHAILTIATCLVWGIVWAILVATGGEKRHQLVVDEFGNVQWQNLGKA